MTQKVTVFNKEITKLVLGELLKVMQEKAKEFGLEVQPAAGTFDDSRITVKFKVLIPTVNIADTTGNLSASAIRGGLGRRGIEFLLAVNLVQLKNLVDLNILYDLMMNHRNCIWLGSQLAQLLPKSRCK